MAQVPTAPIAASSLVAGFALARATGIRPLGAAPLAVAASWCTRRWWQCRGPVVAAGLLGVYGAAFAGSHPLAKRIGAWPSVLTVAAISAGASWALADRHR